MMLPRRILERLTGRHPACELSLTTTLLTDILQYASDVPVRISVPADMLVMQGAHLFVSPEHPFTWALRASSSTVLEAFYASHQPTTIAEMYGLSAVGLAGEELPPWELPWVFRTERRAPPGEHGLSPSAGVSYFGPVSTEKVELEFRRLQRVYASILSRGLDPRRYGDIQGHFMRRNDEYRFFVRGGKHRCAAAVAAGMSEIPVAFKPHWPRLVDAAAVDAWPLVRDGAMDRRLAAQIHAAYFSRPEDT